MTGKMSSAASLDSHTFYIEFTQRQIEYDKSDIEQQSPHFTKHYEENKANQTYSILWVLKPNELQ